MVQGLHRASVQGCALSAPWNWDALGPEEASSQWRTLFDWLRRLAERYELAETLPACWWRHGAMVEELTALWVAWVGAYEDAGAGPDMPLKWHEDFASARARIGDWNRLGCGPNHHRESEALEAEQDEEAFAAFVDADAETRRCRPGLRRESSVLEPLWSDRC